MAETGPETPAPEDGGNTGVGGSDGSSRPVTAPLLFLVGLVAFAGGAVGVLADLVTGHDILRSLLVNGAGAGLLVTWAAVDTLSDPDSRVATPTGAAGTALLLYGLYMLVVGLVVAATTFRHGRLWLGVGVSASGAAGMVVGFVVFPRESVLGDTDEPAPTETTDETAAHRSAAEESVGDDYGE